MCSPANLTSNVAAIAKLGSAPNSRALINVLNQIIKRDLYISYIWRCTSRGGTCQWQWNSSATKPPRRAATQYCQIRVGHGTWPSPGRPRPPSRPRTTTHNKLQHMTLPPVSCHSVAPLIQPPPTPAHHHSQLQPGMDVGTGTYAILKECAANPLKVCWLVTPVRAITHYRAF